MKRLFYQSRHSGAIGAFCVPANVLVAQLFRCAANLLSQGSFQRRLQHFQQADALNGPKFSDILWRLFECQLLQSC